MNKIIVTGCKGQLGIAINKLYEGNREIELVNTDVEELDITDIGKVLAFVREVKPYAIINCAAHTNVNACEKDVDNAYRINAIGAEFEHRCGGNRRKADAGIYRLCICRKRGQALYGV